MKTQIEYTTFKTRSEAQSIIDEMDAQTYYLAHGEYARPIYTARKVRGEDAFYIHAYYFFYSGTFYAAQNGPLTIR